MPWGFLFIINRLKDNIDIIFAFIGIYFAYLLSQTTRT